MAQVSLAWCMAKEPVTAPIIGTTSLSNLEDILGKYSVVHGISGYILTTKSTLPWFDRFLGGQADG